MLAGGPPMNGTALALGVAASASTLAGGLLALRFSARIVLVLGLVAGVVLGVALFDLLPEALSLAANRWSPRAVMGWVALGIGGYMVVDRELAQARRLPARWRAELAPGALTLHSFLDGLGIGLAFQVDAKAGWLVAAAVLAHDLADGVNTVSLCLAARRQRAARRWLAINGAAPLLGVVAGRSVAVAPAMLAPVLALFGGVFLYIGAVELVPRSRALDGGSWITLAILAGMALMYGITTLAG